MAPDSWQPAEWAAARRQRAARRALARGRDDGPPRAEGGAALARWRLHQSFHRLYDSHPGLHLQLLLDQAPTWQAAIDRLRALLYQQSQLAGRGIDSDLVLAGALSLSEDPLEINEGLSGLAAWLLSPEAERALGVSPPQLTMLCVLSHSLAGVRELQLNGRGMRDQEVASLLPQLAVVPTLNILSFADNLLTDQVLPSFTAILPSMPALMQIALAGNAISQAGYTELVARLCARLDRTKIEALGYTTAHQAAVMELLVDRPVQASLGFTGARVAAGLRAQHALIGRVRELRLEGIGWCAEGLKDSLLALAPARSLRHLTLEVRPHVLSWGVILTRLAALPGLRVLGLGHSEVPGEDLGVMAHVAPMMLERLGRVELGLPTPGWSQEPAAQRLLELLDLQLRPRRGRREPAPCHLARCEPCDKPATADVARPGSAARPTQPPSGDAAPPPLSLVMAAEMAEELRSGVPPFQRWAEAALDEGTVFLRRVPGAPGKVAVAAAIV